MRLERLAADRFRNLAPLQLTLDAPFVVLHGPNAQGKTNALEAVHLLATLKPLRGRRVRDLICWGDKEASVAARVRHRGVSRDYRVTIDGTGRTAWLDGKRVSDLGEYFAGIRAVTFTPQDERIVSGSPGRRRDWIDRAAFTAAPAHLDRVRALRRMLDQKSALLRQSRPDLAYLDVLDGQLAAVGAELVHRRQAILDELGPHIHDLYARIAGHAATIELQLATAARGDTVDERREALLERLVTTRDRELQRQGTLVGPQLDDVRLLLEGQQARTFGSRGQVRSLVLALKLAELVAARARDEAPMFLIDDVSSELDRGRTARLVNVLSELGAQVVATTTDPDHMVALPVDETLYLPVGDGVLSRVEKGSGTG